MDRDLLIIGYICEAGERGDICFHFLLVYCQVGIKFNQVNT